MFLTPSHNLKLFYRNEKKFTAEELFSCQSMLFNKLNESKSLKSSRDILSEILDLLKCSLGYSPTLNLQDKESFLGTITSTEDREAISRLREYSGSVTYHRDYTLENSDFVEELTNKLSATGLLVVPKIALTLNYTQRQDLVNMTLDESAIKDKKLYLKNFSRLYYYFWSKVSSLAGSPYIYPGYDYNPVLALGIASRCFYIATACLILSLQSGKFSFEQKSALILAYLELDRSTSYKLLTKSADYEHTINSSLLSLCARYLSLHLGYAPALLSTEQLLGSFQASRITSEYLDHLDKARYLELYRVLVYYLKRTHRESVFTSFPVIGDKNDN